MTTRLTYKEIENKLTPPVDCKTFDVRGSFISGRHLINTEGVDFSGAVLFGCFPRNLHGAVEILAAEKASDISVHGLDLKGLDFTNAELKDVEIKGLDLTNALFKDAHAQRCSFEDIVFEGAVFKNSILYDSSFKGVVMDRADFDHVSFQGSKFQNVTFRGSCFRGGINFHLSSFEDCDFSRANLVRVRMDQIPVFRDPEYGFPIWQKNLFSQTTLVSSKDFAADAGCTYVGDDAALDRRDLSNVELSHLNLARISAKNTEWPNANLVLSLFRDSNFEAANFQGSKLTGVTFLTTSLEKAVFRGCDLSGARFENANLDFVDFRGVKAARAQVVFKDVSLQGAIFDETTEVLRYIPESQRLSMVYKNTIS